MVKRESERVEEDGRPGLRGRRAVQAEQTRLEILGAARRHFAAKGYAATSLKEIAADAGVSVQTVYDSVGSKADLVRRLNDLIDVEAGVGEIAMAIGTESDPAVLVGIPAKVTRRIVERCSDLVRASFDGAWAEPDLAPLTEEGGKRHRGGAQVVAGRLASLKALEPGLSVDAAGEHHRRACRHPTRADPHRRSRLRPRSSRGVDRDDDSTGCVARPCPLSVRVIGTVSS